MVQAAGGGWLAQRYAPVARARLRPAQRPILLGDKSNQGACRKLASRCQAGGDGSIDSGGGGGCGSRATLSEATPSATASRSVLSTKQEGASTDLAVILPRLKEVGRRGRRCREVKCRAVSMQTAMLAHAGAPPALPPADLPLPATASNPRSLRCPIGWKATRRIRRGGNWRACLPSRWAPPASGAQARVRWWRRPVWREAPGIPSWSPFSAPGALFAV